MDPDYKFAGYTLLHYAAQAGHLHLIEFLAANGVSPAAQSQGDQLRTCIAKAPQNHSKMKNHIEMPAGYYRDQNYSGSGKFSRINLPKFADVIAGKALSGITYLSRNLQGVRFLQDKLLE